MAVLGIVRWNIAIDRWMPKEWTKSVIPRLFSVTGIKEYCGLPLHRFVSSSFDHPSGKGLNIESCTCEL